MDVCEISTFLASPIAARRFVASLSRLVTRIEIQCNDKSSQPRSIDLSPNVDNGAAHMTSDVQLLDLLCQVCKPDRFTDGVK